MRVLVINGPNLNLLGTREPEVYGSISAADLEREIVTWAGELGIEVKIEQSNDEGRIIDLIQTYDGDGIVINPGAFTHTSRAIGDAISSVSVPVVEVHISNIYEREPWRRVSHVAPVAVRTIFGRGIPGYRGALRHLVNRAAGDFETVRYGPHPENVGDLRRGDPHLFVLAHGGVWKREFERDLIEGLAVDLARRGHSSWNIEYRRLGDGGGWPGSGHDVLTALDSISLLDIEVEQVTLIGHSAGAYLLMWAATRTRVEVDFHVALGPLLDLDATIDSGGAGADQSRALLQDGAPARLEPGSVETILVHGDSDQIVPVERTIDFARRHGLEHHRTGCDHFSLLDPDKPEWSWVLERLASV